jgi:hypothetical protein
MSIFPRRAGLTVVAVLAAAVSFVPTFAQETADVFQGPAAEVFLSEGRMTRMTEIDVGVTQPQRVTLSHNGVTHRAVFKSIDVEKGPGATRMGDGSVELSFQDSWRTEVAAYQVDRMIGLGLVPATVQRTLRGKVGSLQWWVTSMMAEAERRQQGISPPDVETWNRRMFRVLLFDELICNVDRHLNNMLVTAEFDIRLIDHSRSFRPFDDLREPERLTRFSQTLLDAIRKLEFEDLRSKLNRYLRDGQIRSMLLRRDKILALAEKMVAENGAAAVIYP